MAEAPSPSFNLVHEPWILAQRADLRIAELSLLQVFEQAAGLRQLVGELPTQVFALNRLLLAILYRAPREAITTEDWTHFWDRREFPLEDISGYLSAWSHRFDLFDAERPFYQVADLHTEKNEFSPLTKLIGDAPVGHPFLTTRLGPALDSLSYAEAARWLVHCQAFDPSGIKSGASDDPRVRGGKGYPIGMGAAGFLGGLLLEGDSLLETLLLNLIAADSQTVIRHSERDLPVWERADAQTGAERKDTTVSGPVDLLTWQCRRIRLIVSGGEARQVLISNGDKISMANRHTIEPMTAWRRSETQEKKLGISPVYMPRTHNPDRAIWRGLSALLPHATTSGIPASLPPATHGWLSELASKGVLPANFVAKTRAIGIDYINNSSVVGEIIDDELALPVRLLQEQREDLRNTVLASVKSADDGGSALAQLAGNLAKAAGGEAGPARDSGRLAAFAALDSEFRRWLLGLESPDVDAVSALDAWNTVAWTILVSLGTRFVIDAGPIAWRGREADGKALNSSLAELWFRRSLSKIFPYTSEQKEYA